MTSWVITIDKSMEIHWAVAARAGLWDMKKFHPVQPGDPVFFRLSGGPLLGWGTATEAARKLVDADESPWLDGKAPYTTRFMFRPTSATVIKPSQWKDVRKQLSINPGRLQLVQEIASQKDVAALRSYFASPREEWLAQRLANADAQGIDDPPGLASMTKDQRRLQQATRAIREGQEHFSKTLFELYSRCPVTGTQIATIIEGAHIIRYKGPQSNDVRNGLPLRRDIHKLFDDHLLTITVDNGSYAVRTSPKIASTEYGDFDGQALQSLPTNPQLHPHGPYLAEHNGECRWLKP